MKKCTAFLLLLLPLLAATQAIRVNEFDRFLKKQRLEMAPLALTGLAGKTKLSFRLMAMESTLFLQLEGAGWGASTVDAGNELILLFANDSTRTLKAVNLQSFEPGLSQNTYRHLYYLGPSDLEALSRWELAGLRKYSFTVFSDLSLPRGNGARIGALSAEFLSAVKKANVLKTVKPIQLKDIQKHIGDSVQFCSRVYKTRYFAGSENGPTLLDVQADFSDPFVQVVIYQQDRHKFNQVPEKRYLDKQVCVSGVVALRDNIPYVVVRDLEQIRLASPVTLDELALFEGDSVTVTGQVFTARYLEESKTKPTLLNVGAPFPDQPLTLVIAQADRAKFSKPEEAYLNKTVKVSGRVTSFRGKPQITLQHSYQIAVLSDAAPAFVSVQSNAAKAAPPATGNERDTTAAVVSAGKEMPAEFPGGAAAFSAFLNTQLQQPAGAESRVQKRVLASFRIDADGSCRDIRIVESAGAAYDEEVKRVLAIMPRWQPASANGKARSSVVTQPIVFSATKK